MFKCQQMVAPFGVDGLEQHLLFDRAHLYGAKGHGLGRHVFIGGRFQPRADHILIDAVFGGPIGQGHRDAQRFAQRAVHRVDVPLIGVGFGRHVGIHQILDHLMAHVTGHLGDVVGAHHLAALVKDDLALIVHHIIEFQQLLADVEVAAFDLGLCAFKRFVDPRVNDRLALFHAQRRQHLVELFGPEYAHQVIVQRQKERRPPRIALTARAAAQLVVDPARFMAFRGQNIKTARGLDLFLVALVFVFDPGTDRGVIARRIGGDGLHDLEFDIAAQLDVGAAARHVGGDGDGAQLARIGDDLRLLLMLAGVQDVVGQPGVFQQLAQHFRFLDRGRSDKNRLALALRLADGIDDGLVFLARGAIDRVIIIDARDRQVGRNLDHAQPIDGHEFLGLGGGGAGHARQLVIETKIVLKGDAGQGDVFGLNLTALLGLDRLMQPVRQAPARHHAAGEFIDQHHFARTDDVLLILVEQLVGAQRIGQVMHDRGAFGIIQALPLGQEADLMQMILKKIIARVAEGGAALFFVEGEVILLHLRDDLVDRQIQIRAVLRRA